MRESRLKKKIRKLNNAKRAHQKSKNAAIKAAGPINEAALNGKAPFKVCKIVKHLSVSQYEKLPKIELDQQGNNENRERWAYQAYLKQLDEEKKKA